MSSKNLTDAFYDLYDAIEKSETGSLDALLSSSVPIKPIVDQSFGDLLHFNTS